MSSTFLSNTFILLTIFLQFLSPYILVHFPLSLKMALSEYIFLLLPSLLFVCFTKQNFKNVFLFKSLGLKNILLLILLALLIQPSMQLLGLISLFVFPNNVNYAIAQLSELPLIFTMFIMALTPAVCEEFAFRGVFAYGYKNIDLKKAIFINGLMFGIIHFDGQQFLYAFFMGALFAYIFYLTHSIFSTMIMHFVFNGTQVLLSYLVPISEAANQTVNFKDIIPYVNLTILTMPLLYIVFKLLTRINPSIENETTSNQRIFDFPMAIIIIIFFLTVILPLFF